MRIYRKRKKNWKKFSFNEKVINSESKSQSCVKKSQEFKEKSQSSLTSDIITQSLRENLILREKKLKEIKSKFGEKNSNSEIIFLSNSLNPETVKQKSKRLNEIIKWEFKESEIMFFSPILLIHTSTLIGCLIWELNQPQTSLLNYILRSEVYKSLV